MEVPPQVAYPGGASDVTGSWRCCRVSPGQPFGTRRLEETRVAGVLLYGACLVPELSRLVSLCSRGCCPVTLLSGAAVQGCDSGWCGHRPGQCLSCTLMWGAAIIRGTTLFPTQRPLCFQYFKTAVEVQRLWSNMCTLPLVFWGQARLLYRVASAAIFADSSSVR